MVCEGRAGHISSETKRRSPQSSQRIEGCQNNQYLQARRARSAWCRKGYSSTTSTMPLTALDELGIAGWEQITSYPVGAGKALKHRRG